MADSPEESPGIYCAPRLTATLDLCQAGRAAVDTAPTPSGPLRHREELDNIHQQVDILEARMATTQTIRPLFELDGKVALVTGASKGIGEAMARGLAEFGASVVVSSRKQDAVAAVAEAFTADGLVFDSRYTYK